MEADDLFSDNSFSDNAFNDCDGLIERYKLYAVTDLMKKNIKKILKIEEKIVRIIYEEDNFYGVTFDKSIADYAMNIIPKIHNPNVFTKELLCHKNFPSGDKTSTIFYLCYLRSFPTDKLGKYSDQPGAAVRTLSNQYNCFWAKDVSNYKNQIILVDGIRCRKIVGIDLEAEPDYSKFINVNKKTLKKLFKGERCPLYGLDGQRAKFQIDHRIPVASCKEQGIAPSVLTEDMINNNEWKKHFQILSQQANQDKNGACYSCRRGNEIWVPPSIEEKQKNGRYINRYCHDCSKCYWFDCEGGNK